MDQTVLDEIAAVNMAHAKHQRLCAEAENMAMALQWLVLEPTSEKGWELARIILDRVNAK